MVTSSSFHPGIVTFSGILIIGKFAASCIPMGLSGDDKATLPLSTAWSVIAVLFWGCNILFVDFVLTETAAWEGYVVFLCAGELSEPTEELVRKEFLSWSASSDDGNEDEGRNKTVSLSGGVAMMYDEFSYSAWSTGKDELAKSASVGCELPFSLELIWL